MTSIIVRARPEEVRPHAGKGATAPAATPDGIDCGPAIAAGQNLAAWAFDLAACNVAGWPEGLRRALDGERFTLGTAGANERESLAKTSDPNGT
jgi:hypothetical protein